MSGSSGQTRNMLLSWNVTSGLKDFFQTKVYYNDMNNTGFMSVCCGTRKAQTSKSCTNGGRCDVKRMMRKESMKLF